MIDIWLQDWRCVDDTAPAARLSDGERERLAGIASEHRRRQYLAARLLAYRALDARLGPIALETTIAASGPPWVAGCDRSVHLGIAHCDRLAVCALAEGNRIGIDCESERKRGDHVAIARRYFSTDEYRAVRAGPASWGHFAVMWTVREAVAKAFGGSVLDYLATLIVLPAAAGGYTVRCTNRAVAGGVLLWRQHGSQVALFVRDAESRPGVAMHPIGSLAQRTPVAAQWLAIDASDAKPDSRATR